MCECEDSSSDFSAVNSSAVSRDLVAIITALEYNQWFTKVSIKDYKLVTSIKLQWRLTTSTMVQMFSSMLSDSLTEIKVF